MSGAEITITCLGSGGAIPPNGRHHSSIAVRHQNGLILLDCGEGTQFNLRKYQISIRKEFVIWISHLHSDHFLGVPGLIASLELLDRKEDIHIIGPYGVKNTIAKLLEANFVSTTFNVVYTELKTNDEFIGSGYTLETIKALHDGNAMSLFIKENDVKGKINLEKMEKLGLEPGPEISKLQLGEKIMVNGKVIMPSDVIDNKRRGRRIFYSGDTMYNELLVDKIGDCDLFIHEGTYPNELEDIAIERQHSTISQAASLASMIKPKKLLITHFSSRIVDFEREQKIAKNIFEQTYLAYEGLEIKLPYLYHKDKN